MAAGPAVRSHHYEVGAPSFACFSRRVGGRLIAHWHQRLHARVV